MSTGFKILEPDTNRIIDIEDVLVKRDLFSRSTIKSTGYNINGQLGDNTNVDKESPVQEYSKTSIWKILEANDNHTTAIKTDGTLWNWGQNTYGQLGDNTVDDKYYPVQTISGGNDWKSICSGSLTSAAIKTDGTLWLWGYNAFNQVSPVAGNKLVPTQNSASATDWYQAACGAYHVAAIKTNNSLWLWGRNQYGELGDDSTTLRTSPVQTSASGTDWKQVSCGFGFTGAVKTDGTIFMWGYNNYGSLGINQPASADKHIPTQEATSATNWKCIDCGAYHVAAIKTDGTLWMWGLNSYGQLGIGNNDMKFIPTQVGTSNNWKYVSCGSYHTVAIKTDGTLWAWGNNIEGQYGNGSVSDSLVPIQIGTNRYKQANAGGSHTALIEDEVL